MTREYNAPTTERLCDTTEPDVIDAGQYLSMPVSPGCAAPAQTYNGSTFTTVVFVDGEPTFVEVSSLPVLDEADADGFDTTLHVDAVAPDVDSVAMHYTTDGSTPTIDSPLWPDDGIDITETTTVKIIATSEGEAPSDVVEETYYLRAADPVLTGNHLIGYTITCATEGSTIYYLNDSAEYVEYTEPLFIDYVTEVFATAPNHADSDVVVVGKVDAVVSSCNSIQCSFSTTETGASIYYRTGTSAAWVLYVGFPVARSTVATYAYANKSGMIDSDTIATTPLVPS